MSKWKRFKNKLLYRLGKKPQDFTVSQFKELVEFYSINKLCYVIREKPTREVITSRMDGQESSYERVGYGSAMFVAADAGISAACDGGGC